jgi:hypothetical protein
VSNRPLISGQQGGFRLELLDSNEKLVRELTDAGDAKFVVGDTT